MTKRTNALMHGVFILELLVQPLNSRKTYLLGLRRNIWSAAASEARRRFGVCGRNGINKSAVAASLCRLDRFPATETDFTDSYLRTRGWSPFNYELSVRVNRGDRVFGVASGHSISILADGSVT